MIQTKSKHFKNDPKNDPKSKLKYSGPKGLKLIQKGPIWTKIVQPGNPETGKEGDSGKEGNHRELTR